MTRMEFKDYYATLGVAKTATDKEIKQAFRKLARKYHPDVNPGDKAAEAQVQGDQRGHEVLERCRQAQKYDELGANWRQYEQAASGRPARLRSAAGTSTSAAAAAAASAP